MKNGKPKSVRLSPAVKRNVGRAAAAVILLAMGFVLVFWNQGKISLPFLQRRDFSKKEAPQTTEEQVLLFDYPAYRTDILKSLYSFRDVENGAGLITGTRFEWETQSLVLDSLSGKNGSYLPFAGFLEKREENGSAYFLLPDNEKFADSASFSPLYDRDADGNPVFRGQDGSYYIFNQADKQMTAAIFDANLDSKKIDAYCPPYWFSETDRMQLILENGLYGYKGSYEDKNGRTQEVLIEPQYPIAFPYNEGFAVMIDAEDNLIIRNAEGEIAFAGKRFVKPEAEGIDALGFSYFQNGLLRVILAETNDEGQEILREAVITTSGTEFSIPQGYAAVSYSDGVFLLTDGAKFGYYDAHGAWVASPVYANGSPFYEGLAVVQNEEGLYGIVDLRGVEVIPCAFPFISDMSGGVMTLYSPEAGWQLIYKVQGVFGDRESAVPPSSSDYIVKVPVTRHDGSETKEEDDLFVFPDVTPPKRTTVPEITVKPPSTRPPKPTDPPTTDPPATDPPTTDPSVTDPPGTIPPTTDPPVPDPTTAPDPTVSK